jgi:hypothetical protein
MLSKKKLKICICSNTAPQINHRLQNLSFLKLIHLPTLVKKHKGLQRYLTHLSALQTSFLKLRYKSRNFFFKNIHQQYPNQCHIWHIQTKEYKRHNNSAPVKKKQISASITARLLSISFHRYS